MAHRSYQLLCREAGVAANVTRLEAEMVKGVLLLTIPYGVVYLMSNTSDAV